MKKQKNILVKSKERKGVNEVSKFLHNLADKIAEKKIVFANGNHETVVDIAENVIMSVKAGEKESRKKGMISKLTLGIKWSEGLDVNTPLEIK